MDGKEVGVAFEEPGTPATEVVIHSTEIVGAGLIMTDQNGIASAPSKGEVSNAVYTMSSNTPHVTTNPINNEPVQYFKITKETPSITLIVGVPEEA